MENKKHKIVVITPFYNPGILLEQCVSSLISQKYDNFSIIFIDDASTDNSWNKLPHDDKRAICIKNEKNLTALENIYNSIINNYEEDAIYILLDGDDFLLNKNVLTYVNEIYCKGLGGINKIVEDDQLKNYSNNIKFINKVLMSYGSCTWSNGNKCFSRPYTKEEFTNIKSHQYKISHLRTFLGKAFDEIIKQDPKLKCFKDESGNFYRSGYDTAIFYPLLQICGFEHTFYNSKPLYYYNLHPNNDHALNQKLQWHVHDEALKKPSFKKIENI